MAGAAAWAYPKVCVCVFLQGLLQKQRELERDLSPVLKHFENKPR